MLMFIMNGEEWINDNGRVNGRDIMMKVLVNSHIKKILA